MTDLSGKGGVFFLFGEDEFTKEAALGGLVDRHLDPGLRDFNYDLLRGGELDLEALASAVGTPPMMAEWRVVVVRDAEALSSSSRYRDAILRWAEKPAPGLALILVADIGGSKAKFWKELRKKAKSKEFRAIDPHDAPGWLMERAREVHGVEMDEEAARGLAAAVGAELGILAREMEKLVEVVGDRGRITPDDVEAAGTRLPRQDRWAWFDLVGSRRFGEAIETLPVLLSQGESGVGLVIGLGSHLLRIGTVVTSGKATLEKALPPHQRWLAGRIASQAGGWTPETVDRAVRGLLRADRLLKASGFSDEHLLEEWLLARRTDALTLGAA